MPNKQLSILVDHSRVLLASNNHQSPARDGSATPDQGHVVHTLGIGRQGVREAVNGKLNHHVCTCKRCGLRTQVRLGWGMALARVSHSSAVADTAQLPQYTTKRIHHDRSCRSCSYGHVPRCTHTLLRVFAKGVAFTRAKVQNVRPSVACRLMVHRTIGISIRSGVLWFQCQISVLLESRFRQWEMNIEAVRMAL